MSNLFVEPKYTRQSGFVILVRDNRLYRHGLNGEWFSSFSGLYNDIHFNEVNLTTDKVYVLPTEQTMCEYVLGGKCLDKFKYKLEVKADIDAVIKALDSGKLMGYQTGTTKNDERVRVHKGVGRSIVFVYKEPTQAIWYERNNDSISGGRDRFFVFDTEYELWNWIITSTTQTA